VTQKLLILAALATVLSAQRVAYKIETVAGHLPNDDGGPATAAILLGPAAAIPDRSGALFIAEAQAGRIRRVTPGGTIETVGRHFASDLALDGQGNLLYVDGGPLVWKISPTGATALVAGSSSGQAVDGVAATMARLRTVTGVAADRQGNIYIADRGESRVWRITASGILRAITSVSMVPSPGKVAVDAAGNLYITQTFAGGRVWKYSTAGVLSVLAGNGEFGRPVPGSRATSSPFGILSGIAADSSGSVLIADAWFRMIVKVTPDGQLALVAGTGEAGNSGDGGPATAARFSRPCRDQRRRCGHCFRFRRVRPGTPDIPGWVDSNGGRTRSV
jgi:DNA-binding beta-propeller fold protein YncE